jgi:hypothetical protein
VAIGGVSPAPGVLREGRVLGHPAQRPFPVLPDALKAGGGHGVVFHLFCEGQRPEFQQGCPPGQGFPNLPEQQDL